MELWSDLATELQRIYDSEINIRIGWFRDGGSDLRLGDATNGYLAEETLPSTDEILHWLQEAIAHFYPNSEYASSLSSEVRQRAAQRLFRPRNTECSSLSALWGTARASAGDDRAVRIRVPSLRRFGAGAENCGSVRPTTRAIWRTCL
jgi:hypothetical protein